jgi:hypothetical protein
MRWLSKRIRDERGATAVLVGILMVPLLGFAAISVDVGALYSERAQLQNGADAAALAIAQECAEDNKCDAPSALASTFANLNSNDGASNVLTPTFPTPKSVLVTTSTKDAATGAPSLSHPFARFIGINASTVEAKAVAEWGSPLSSRGLPLAISNCDFAEAEAAATSGSNPKELVLIRYDTNKTCKGPTGAPIPGGFGWLDRGGKTCETTVVIGVPPAPNLVQSEPGNSYPGSCDSTMQELDVPGGTTIAVPIFNGADTSKGSANSYTLRGFAAFHITGWKLSGGNSMPQVNTDPAAPRCEGSCRGIQGYFTNSWIDAKNVDGALGGADLGLRVVRLID